VRVCGRGALKNILTSVAVIAVLVLTGGCAASQTPTTTSTILNTPPSGSQVTGVNHDPIIDGIISEYHQIERGKTGGLRCAAHDEDGDTLTYMWSADRGTISGQGVLVTYTAPDSYVDAKIMVTVSDGRGGFARGTFVLPVVCCSYANKNSDWSG
jgi:hypothetical protein